jgi:hypothetical protein
MLARPCFLPSVSIIVFHERKRHHLMGGKSSKRGEERFCAWLGSLQLLCETHAIGVIPPKLITEIITMLIKV